MRCSIRLYKLDETRTSCLARTIDIQEKLSVGFGTCIHIYLAIHFISIDMYISRAKYFAIEECLLLGWQIHH